MTGPRYTGPLSGQLCQCAKCGQTFGGLSGFDRHRIGSYADPGQWQGTRHCMTAAELHAAGLSQDDRGIWRQPARFAAGVGISGPSVALPATGVAP